MVKLGGHNLSGEFVLQAMLEYQPAKRISAKRAVDHPYFDDLDKSQLPDEEISYYRSHIVPEH